MGVEMGPSRARRMAESAALLSALNLNLHFHMLILDGAYVDSANGSSMRFRRVKAPTSAELTQLTHSGGAPHQGRKVFTLQTLPASHEPFDGAVGKVAGFSLHAGVAARADKRQKPERLCRYIARPAVSGNRLSLLSNGPARYELNETI
jgi:hypothetical protein